MERTASNGRNRGFLGGDFSFSTEAWRNSSGLMISFFGSLISFFRSFISGLGGEFSFSRELSGISSVGSVIRSQEFVFLIGRGRIYNSSLERILSIDGSTCSCHRIVWRKLSTTWRISSGR